MVKKRVKMTISKIWWRFFSKILIFPAGWTLNSQLNSKIFIAAVKGVQYFMLISCQGLKCVVNFEKFLSHPKVGNFGENFLVQLRNQKLFYTF